ncbi:hypothetical protein ACS0TY_033802 [Phlomoides rotata]
MKFCNWLFVVSIVSCLLAVGIIFCYILETYHHGLEADLISPLISQLQTAISNATSGGSNEQIMHLVTLNCIKPLCDLLICPDARIVAVCLEGLNNYLRVGEAEKGNTGGVNYFTQLIDEADGSKKIENLQTHDNTEIYEKAMRILEAYWQVFYENLSFHLLNLLSRAVKSNIENNNSDTL